MFHEYCSQNIETMRRLLWNFSVNKKLRNIFYNHAEEKKNTSKKVAACSRYQFTFYIMQ